MATVRKTFVYDPIQDSDIHEWINGIKNRERSKYIRIVIRSLLNEGSQITDEPVDSKNTEKIQITYDDLEDRDIHLWFESLPQRGQSDYIKRAIRAFIAGDSTVPKTRNTPPVDVNKKIEPTKQKPVDINETIKPTKQKSEGKEEQLDDYVDLNNDFLDNIGK